MKKDFSFYEHVGILVPGSALLFGLLIAFPDIKAVLADDGITVGGLGIFLLVAYATGHLVAAVGNVIEALYWRARGGMPSNWIIGSSPRLLSTVQIAKLETLVKSRLGLEIASLANIDVREWFPITRQIYADVARDGRVDRIDTFNGNYGLNRGLCSALLILAVVSVLADPAHYQVAAALFAFSLVFLFRMHRFGVHYARELYSQFLLLR